jgi:hypothetical protein
MKSEVATSASVDEQKSPEVGARVGAISHSNSKSVYLFGYGVYEGDFPCKGSFGAPNPRIKLDNGQTVWGYQCWWYSEEEIKNWIGSREVVMVDAPGEEAEKAPAAAPEVDAPVTEEPQPETAAPPIEH